MRDPMQAARELADVLDARANLETKLATLREQETELKTFLLEAIEEERFPATAKVGGKTLFIKRQIFAGKEAPDEEIVQALKDSDLGDYVKVGFNSQSVSAYIRDVAREHTGGSLDMLSVEEIRALLPEPLRTVLKVTEKVELGHRRS